MSDSPAPEPAPSPITNTPVSGVPSPPAPKESRRRRLWRWSKKWGKRLALIAFVLFLATGLVYSIHRHLAFKASDKALADVRAELDANEPGWQYEDIEAAHNATVPPPEKNSYTLVKQFPRVQVLIPKPEGEEEDDRSARLGRQIEVITFEENLAQWPTSELPTQTIRDFLSAVERELPPTHPIIVELARTTTGGLPMVPNLDPTDLARKDGVWAPIWEISHAQHYLEKLGVSCAARREYVMGATCAHALLNAGRAVGSMPRTYAQIKRGGASWSAARTAARILAWGEPGETLNTLQHELLAEAEVECVSSSIRGDRAALSLAFPLYTTADELAHLTLQFPDADVSKLSLIGPNRKRSGTVLERR